MKRKYLIGEVAKALDVSNDTLRYYDRLNIISPSKDETNGYRYYTYEDIVKLYYVILLKSLDMPLNTIKNLINNCDINTLKCVMENQENIIETKINKLIKLKNTVTHYKNDLNRASSFINSFDIVPSPCFLYKEVSIDINDELIKASKQLEDSGFINHIVLSCLFNKDYFNGKNLEDSFVNLACGIKKQDININDIKSFNFFSYPKCLHTVLKATIDFTDNELDEIEKYIKENNIKISADIMINYIGFESSNNVTFDLVEIWIPIE